MNLLGGEMRFMKLSLMLICFILLSSCREEILEFTEHPETGKLYINSTPKGAEIFLNITGSGKILLIVYWILKPESIRLNFGLLVILMKEY